MIGALLPAQAGAPQNWCEGEDGQKEERSHDFKPDFPANGAERLKETREAAADVTGGLSGGLGPGAQIRGLGLGAAR